MIKVVDFPLVIFAVCFFALWLSVRIGLLLSRKRRNLQEGVRDDFALIEGATLTLLGLIIGFSFSMALSRYDQRKLYEEGEANAIGTEYLRASLLPAADGAKVRAMLQEYLAQRILFYTTRDEEKIRGIDDHTERLQGELWSAVQAPSSAQPTPVIALAVSGMNDVLNSQGYTQAAWLNRIPIAAWILMVAIAMCSNLLMGYGSRHGESERVLLLVLPLVLSVSFFLIAELDSPRSGAIYIHPQNLTSLSQTISR